MTGHRPTSQHRAATQGAPDSRRVRRLVLAAIAVMIAIFASSFALLALALDLRTAMAGAAAGLVATLTIGTVWLVVAQRVVTRLLQLEHPRPN